MRRLLAALLALITGCSAPDYPPLGLTASHANAYNATVVVLDPDDEVALCTGEFIAPDRIATAAHCLEPYEAQVGDMLSYIPFSALATKDLTPQLAAVHAVSVELDLAVLRSLEPSKVWVTIGEAPAPGSIVHALGHPRGKLYTETHGFVLRATDEVITALVLVNFGSSGGGLYNGNYELVGITLRMFAGGNVAQFGNAAQLRALMK